MYIILALLPFSTGCEKSISPPITPKRNILSFSKIIPHPLMLFPETIDLVAVSEPSRIPGELLASYYELVSEFTITDNHSEIVSNISGFSKGSNVVNYIEYKKEITVNTNKFYRGFPEKLNSSTSIINLGKGRVIQGFSEYTHLGVDILKGHEKKIHTSWKNMNSTLNGLKWILPEPVVIIFNSKGYCGFYPINGYLSVKCTYECPVSKTNNYVNALKFLVNSLFKARIFPVIHFFEAAKNLSVHTEITKIQIQLSVKYSTAAALLKVKYLKSSLDIFKKLKVPGDSL